MTSRHTHYTTDHGTITGWAERHQGKPAIAHDTIASRDLDQLTIVLPGQKVDKSVEVVEWDRFFDLFDKGNHVFVYEDSAEGGREEPVHQIVDGESIARLRLREATGHQRAEPSAGEPDRTPGRGER